MKAVDSPYSSFSDHFLSVGAVRDVKLLYLIGGQGSYVELTCSIPWQINNTSIPWMFTWNRQYRFVTAFGELYLQPDAFRLVLVIRTQVSFSCNTIYAHCTLTNRDKVDRGRSNGMCIPQFHWGRTEIGVKQEICGAPKAGIMGWISSQCWSSSEATHFSTWKEVVLAVNVVAPTQDHYICRQSTVLRKRGQGMQLVRKNALGLRLVTFLLPELVMFVSIIL